MRPIAAIFAAALALFTNPTGPAAAQDIAIAINGPMTGEYATFGDQFRKGAEAAIADINAAGGVLGRQLRGVVGDDACDPSQATALANKSAGAGVALVIGHFCSGSSIPASKVYAEEGIVQISPGSTNPKLTDERAGPGIFRVCGRDDQQGGVAGAYLAKNFAGKKVAFAHDKSAYGQGLAEATRAAMNAAGLKEVLFEAITPKEKDYTALVTKLKSLGADVLYLGGYHTEGGQIVRQLRSAGMATILMGGDSLLTKEYWDITGAAGEGTLMTFSPDPRLNPGAAELVAKFQAKGIDPEGYVLYAYASLQVWVQAVTAAGSIEAGKVIAALNGGEFATAIGKFRFDAKGDPNLPPYTVYRWAAGKYAQLAQ